MSEYNPNVNVNCICMAPLTINFIIYNNNNNNDRTSEQEVCLKGSLKMSIFAFIKEILKSTHLRLRRVRSRVLGALWQNLCAKDPRQTLTHFNSFQQTFLFTAAVSDRQLQFFRSQPSTHQQQQWQDLVQYIYASNVWLWMPLWCICRPHSRTEDRAPPHFVFLSS